eukprot:TRINITY_DN6160_c0_g1_i1.p1 TRINITY_DN6160_c0_g1~~TRINITY_DN6160_c0_g1_i1.p1  ORF type:complete len:140 (+),score=40.55 TRINITY_DN6160_c0_g1_i1:245-664(+)
MLKSSCMEVVIANHEALKETEDFLQLAPDIIKSITSKAVVKKEKEEDDTPCIYKITPEFTKAMKKSHRWSTPQGVAESINENVKTIIRYQSGSGIANVRFVRKLERYLGVSLVPLLKREYENEDQNEDEEDEDDYEDYE